MPSRGAKGSSAGRTSYVECKVVEPLQEMMKLKRIRNKYNFAVRELLITQTCYGLFFFFLKNEGFFFINIYWIFFFMYSSMLFLGEESIKTISSFSIQNINE